MLDNVLVLFSRNLPTQNPSITLVQVPDVQRIPSFSSEGRTVDGSFPSQDGTSVDKDGRSVVPRSGDHTGGHVLVARRDEDGPVVSMGFDVHLEGIGDDVSARKRVEHAIVAHPDVVAARRTMRSLGQSKEVEYRPSQSHTDLTPGTAVWKPTMLACSTPVLTISPKSRA